MSKAGYITTSSAMATKTRLPPSSVLDSMHQSHALVSAERSVLENIRDTEMLMTDMASAYRLVAVGKKHGLSKDLVSFADPDGVFTKLSPKTSTAVEALTQTSTKTWESQTALESIGESVSGAGKKIVEFAKKIWEGIKSLVGKLIDWISGLFDRLQKNAKQIDALIPKVKAAQNGITTYDNEIDKIKGDFLSMEAGTKAFLALSDLAVSDGDIDQNAMQKVFGELKISEGGDFESATLRPEFVAKEQTLKEAGYAFASLPNVSRNLKDGRPAQLIKTWCKQSETAMKKTVDHIIKTDGAAKPDVLMKQLKDGQTIMRLVTSSAREVGSSMVNSTNKVIVAMSAAIKGKSSNDNSDSTAVAS